MSKTETKKDKKFDQKKSKPGIDRPSEKFINDEEDKEKMKIAGKLGKKKNEKEGKKSKKPKKLKHEKKSKKSQSQAAKNTIMKVGMPKELIPEDIKIVKKMEKITAEDLPGAYGDDPTIGMKCPNENTFF